MKTGLPREIRNKVIALMGKDHVRLGDVLLPPEDLRSSARGRELKNDQVWIDSARGEAGRLVRDCGLTAASRVLDVGCGPGRLAIGILQSLGKIEAYRGLDVDRRPIDWCTRYITKDHPTFRFVHFNVENARYNPGGKRLDGGVAFPFPDREFDIIYLYSVFSHMEEKDVRAYLREFGRVLATEGRIFMTGCIEEGVPSTSVNPRDYKKDWRGPLHCVRYERGFFESMLSEHGLAVDRFDYATETGGQSAMYVSRR